MTERTMEEPETLVITKHAEENFSTWTPRMVMSIDDAVQQIRARDEILSRVLRPDHDYGVIPGTGTKPALLKPGAERLLKLYGLSCELSDEVPPVEDVTGEQHGGEPFIQYRRTARIYRQTGPQEQDRMLVASASGVCSSWEKKYRYRSADRLCPDCGKATVLKSKPRNGARPTGREGWFCWAKKGGCGATFSHDDDRIPQETAGQVANPDIVDTINTVLKMADKRAMVAATLLATGWSDIVTQDLDDQMRNAAPPPPHEEAPIDVQAREVVPDTPEIAAKREACIAVLQVLTPAERKAIIIQHGWTPGAGKVTDWVRTLDLEVLGAMHMLLTSPEDVEPEPAPPGPEQVNGVSDEIPF